MNEQKVMKKLQEMASSPENTLKKLLSEIILKQDDSLEFITDAKKFGMSTLYRYEAEDDELEDLYTEYQQEIESLIQNHIGQIEEILSRSSNQIHSMVWWAMDYTVSDIYNIVKED